MNKSHRPLFLLALLTLLAAALRFVALNRPSLWGDEAWTFSRVCGSYRDMLDLVSFAGFAPLHYELYWWIGQHVKLTPIVMRLVPAISGTLMIPAMYFLARQFVSARTALVTALLATVSAYLLVYSRDAKMYMHFWLACTLSMGCFLWWLREPNRIRWYCWVAASIVMVGLHAPGTMLLGIQALIFLSHRGIARWRRAVAFVLGVAVILSGISIYYARFSRLKDRVLVEKKTPAASQPSYDIHLGNTGIFWVPWYNQGRSTSELVLYATTAFLFSWEYPPAGQVPTIPPRAYKILIAATWILIGLLALGVFPWRRGGDRRTEVRPPNEWWRGLLWVECWILLPAYAFYCVTIPNYLTPVDWLRALGQGRGFVALIAIAVALICFFACGSTWRERGMKAGMLAISLTTLWALCGMVAIVVGSMKWSESVWLPRYLGVIWPAVAIAMAVLFMRLPTKPLRIAAIGAFVAINLLQFSWRVFGESEPPTALLARDVIDAQAKDATTRTYTKLSRLPGVEPGEGVIGSAAFRYYLAALSNIPCAPVEFQVGPLRRESSNVKYEDHFRFRPPMQNPFMLRFTDLSTWIPNELRSSEQVKRIVVWELFETKDADLAKQDRLKPNLPGWRRVSQDTYAAYDHWRWRLLYLSRRSVYEKQSS
ncbi:MAG TPA: glycosyltransferase family 39 protein [Tepidisphaeraceae bacterium]|nr:glycosyltransferase family 39 protein [Tepidisphaeraceae bacterium]